MATIDEFNIAQFAKIPEAIGRVGDARIALAQNALARSQQLGDEERRRAERLADTEALFRVEQTLREKADDRAFRKKLEAEAASLGVDTKGTNAELLRAIRVQAKKEKDDDRRQERLDRLDDLEEEMNVRADIDIRKTKTAVGIADQAQRDKAEKDKSVIEAFHKRWADRSKELKKELSELQRPPSPIEIASHMAQNPDVQAILAKLTPEQQLLFKGGNINQVIKATEGIFGRDTTATRIMNQAKVAAEEGIGAAKVLAYQDRLARLKERRFNEEQGLAKEYGMRALVVPGQEDEEDLLKPSLEERAGLPSRDQGPPNPFAAAAPAVRPAVPVAPASVNPFGIGALMQALPNLREPVGRAASAVTPFFNPMMGSGPVSPAPSMPVPFVPGVNPAYAPMPEPINPFAPIPRLNPLNEIIQDYESRTIDPGVNLFKIR